jgi:hypothetical protein
MSIRIRLVWMIVVAALATGVALAVVDPFSRAKASGPDNGYPTSTATITRQTLSSQTQVSGTLGYAGSYAVLNKASGTLTWLPTVGTVIHQGHVIYILNDAPVVLLRGTVPAYRTLSEGMTGADVTQLNADLVALGYATSSGLSPNSDTFTSATATAVEKLQAAIGIPQTGALTLGQAVFLPISAARITAVDATLGGQAGPGQPVMRASSTNGTVDLDAAQQAQVKVGDRVTITLPGQRTTPGVVSSVGTVATTPAGGGGGGGNSSPTITVLITPTDPGATGHIDQAPVEVAITTGTAEDALVVPVAALLATTSGAYAVEVVDPDGVHHLVGVTLGLFDDADGLVQVFGALTAGQHVVVPGT